LQSQRAWRHRRRARQEPPDMPLSLNDDEYAAVMQVAAPIHPQQRDAFLRSLAAELEKYPEIGPGVVFRCAAELQKRFGVTARSQTLAAAPREQLARQA
jgi:hypothetical protein